MSLTDKFFLPDVKSLIKQADCPSQDAHLGVQLPRVAKPKLFS